MVYVIGIPITAHKATLTHYSEYCNSCLMFSVLLFYGSVTFVVGQWC